MKEPILYLNGRLLPARRALVSVRDHGFLYGDGVYETLRVYGGRPFRVGDHLRRLAASMKGIRLVAPLSQAGFARAIERTIDANPWKEAVLRLTVTRGGGPYGFDIRPCGPPTVAIEAYPFKPYPPAFHRRGISVAVIPVRRNSPLTLPPWIKSTSCMNGILGKMASIDMRADEGLFLALDGRVAEGTVSNVFAVKGGTLYTPALTGHLLSGVTRGWVLRLARRLRIPAREAALPSSLLNRADELFLTNTTMEVMPVGELRWGGWKGRRAIVTRRKRLEVGPVTRRLMAAFTASVER